mgnify:CR=1 FL=1
MTNTYLKICFHFSVLKHIVLCLLISVTSTTVSAQAVESLQQKLLHNHCHSIYDGRQVKRDRLQAKRNHTGILTGLSASLLYVYQNVLSEQIQADCTYQITCSQYTKWCIERYGSMKGIWAGINQFMKCNSGNHKNHANYKLDDSYCKCTTMFR